MAKGLESRLGGVSGPFGKCDRRLDIPVSETLEERIIAMAALNGVPKAEYARRILEKAMFGEFAMAQSLAGINSQVNAR